jgi:hypothetical protein
VFGHLDAVPFLGQVEIHDGPFSLLGGAIHLPVSTSITTRNVFFDGGTAGLIANAGTATLGLAAQGRIFLLFARRKKALRSRNSHCTACSAVDAFIFCSIR